MTVEGEKAFVAKRLVKAVIIGDSHVFVADVDGHATYEALLDGRRGESETVKSWVGIAKITGVNRHVRVLPLDLRVVVLITAVTSYNGENKLDNT